MDDNDGNTQVESNAVSGPSATFLKFRILAGWSDFSVVHSISVKGRDGSDGGESKK